MSSASPALLCLLALSLSLTGPAAPRSPSLASASSPQSSDQESIGRLTEQYGHAIAAADLDPIRRFWNPQSPNLTSRLGFYQGLFSTSRIEFVSLKVTRLDVAGESAVSHLTTDERFLDKIARSVSTEHERFHGAVRSLEWSRIGGEWKIERETLLQEELAARLESAISEEEAQRLLEKEKAIVTDVLVKAFIERSSRHRMGSDFVAASRSLRLAQQVAEKIGDQVGLAKACLYLAWVKDGEGESEQILPNKLRALELYEAAGNKLGEAIALYSISHTYHELGDYHKAFDCANRSLRLSEEMNYRGTAALAFTELAHLYDAQNNSQQVLRYLEAALAIYQELGNRIHASIARYSIVEEHTRLGNYDRALEIYEDILKQVEGRGDQVGVATIRMAMGRIHVAQGRFADAEDHTRKALEAFEAANYPPMVIHSLIDLSEVYLSKGKYAEALPHAERAVSLLRQRINYQSLYNALTRLGYCHLGLNNLPEARRAFEEAISTAEELRAQAVGGVEERRRNFEEQLDAYHGMLRLMVRENQPHEALVFAERTKARVLLDVLQQGRVNVQKAMTAKEQEQERRLKSEMTRLNTQLTRAAQSNKADSARDGEVKSRLEKARLDYEAFQNVLYTTHPELRVQRGGAPVIHAAELSTLLQDEASALLEYVVTADTIYLFAITKAAAKAEAEVRVYSLPIKRDDIARQIEGFRQQLAGRDLSFRASANKLYDLLLKPAEAQLRGKTNLIIAPDDKLWDLPFQALLTKANRFLVEQAAIAYAPSLTVLREMTRRRKNEAVASSGTLLALGNPLLGKETINHAAMTLRDEKLDPLPEAEQEVRELRRLYGMTRSKVYIGAEAREDRVKKEAGQARILHFATHGTLNNASPMYSHLVLAQGNASEDGLLEAWELTQLDLNADLAVLSACETARGRIGAGEGMIGLSWAMFIAGVPSTVVSQWKVESAGTRDLMVNFHRILMSQRGAGKSKPPKAEALRQAALKLMMNHETRHPFYWAGFVLVGDPR